MGIFLRYLSAPTPQKGPDAAAQRGGYGAPPPLGVSGGADIGTALGTDSFANRLSGWRPRR